MESDGINPGSSSISKIQTFVFLDMEATGIYNSPRMLELSLIALSRKDLIEMKNAKDKNSNNKAVPVLPRVLHKYSRLFYPRKLITPDVEELNGLSNAMLSHLSPFNECAANGIRAFLDFPSPICLVAHNGYSFDFKVLKAELEYIDAGSSFDQLFCIDSLQCIRNLDHISEMEEAEFLGKLAEKFSDSDSLDEPVSPAESAKNTSIAKIETPPQSSPSKNLTCQGYATPGKYNFPSTPPMPRTPIKNEKILENSTPPAVGIATNSVSKMKNAKRVLSFGKRQERKPYSQPVLYKRLFKQEYEAHKAENDAIALLQICANYGASFANWCDQNCRQFADIQPRWTYRKSFKI